MHRIRFKKIHINYYSLCFLTALIIIAAKIFQFLALPSKYFYDSYNILGYMEYTPTYVDSSYRFITNLFKAINVFQFSTLVEWGIALSIFFFFPFMRIMKGIDRFSLLQFVFYVCCIFLSAVYVFNVAKEVAQITVFFMVYDINHMKWAAKYTKRFLTILVLCLEGFYFRRYYFLVAVYYLIIWICIDNKVIQRIGHVKFLLLAILTVFGTTYILRFGSIGNYLRIISVRDSLTLRRIGNADSNTLIVNLISTNNSFLNWCINYVINTIRMFFPLELIFKGPFYIPFVVFQMIVSWFYFLSYKNLRMNNSCYLSLFILFTAFAIVAVIFEPDFGSWIRHETTLWPLFVPLFINSPKYKEID